MSDAESGNPEKGSIILILKRRIGEKIDVNEDVQLTVIDADDEFVTVGIQQNLSIQNGSIPSLLSPDSDKPSQEPPH